MSSSLLEVLRYSTCPTDTLGLLSLVGEGSKQFYCYTLEDTAHAQKIAGDTRIPAGQYELSLRTAGGFHSRYSELFPDMHKGMIWVRNVPNFEHILWHIGNTSIDTRGCLLLGDSARQNRAGPGQLVESKHAYARVYPLIRDLILQGPTYVRYVDIG